MSVDLSAAPVRSQLVTAGMQNNWLRSGLYYFTVPTIGTGTASAANGVIRATPFDVPNPVTLSKIGAEITIIGDAGSKYRLGVWADDGADYPSTLLLDAGTIDGDSATVQEIDISLPLVPGRYWVGGAGQVITVTAPTVRASGAAMVPSGGQAKPAAAAVFAGYTQSGVTGAFSNWAGTPSTSSTAHRLFVKIT